MRLPDYIKKIGPEEFSRLTGLSIYTAHSYSTGRREPKPDTARMIEVATRGKVKVKDCYRPVGEADRQIAEAS